MNEWLSYLLISVLSYLFGSLLFAQLIAKLKGIDLRKVGSKNTGALNLYRATHSKLWVCLATLGDVGKGWLAVTLTSIFLGAPQALLFAAIFVVLGHQYSLFLKFKGGKGVATTMGVYASLLVPSYLPLSLFGWITFNWVILWASLFGLGYVLGKKLRIGRISAWVCLPIIAFLLKVSMPIVFLFVILSLLGLLKEAWSTD
jgi:glycerol-3-phosphate acyltransferase PlsY